MPIDRLILDAAVADGRGIEVGVMEKQNQPQARPIIAKWKINSNGYGGQILAVAGIFIIVLPLGLYIFRRLFNLAETENAVTLIAIKISLAVGVVIVGLFTLLLTVEFIQDCVLDTYYSRNKKIKVSLSDGQYECPHCGARNIRALDKHCPICGKDFQLQ